MDFKSLEFGLSDQVMPFNEIILLGMQNLEFSDSFIIKFALKDQALGINSIFNI